jgi:putative peptidoglycan lipid II flippase
MAGALKRTSTILFALTIINALASYLREMLMAALFGASGITDAYLSAYALAMTASDLVLGAALMTCCVPVLAPLADRATDTLIERRQVISAIILATVGVGGILAILLRVFLPQVMDIVAPGLAGETRAMAISMGGWTLWLLPLNGLVMLFTLALNAHRRFVLPALSWPLINTVFILVILSLTPAFGPQALIIAAVLGPAFVATLLAAQLYRMGLLRLVRPDFSSTSMLVLWRLARPMLVTVGLGSSAGLLMISHLIVRSYGSHLRDGTISALAYAFRIYEVPVTLATNTVGVLLLPIVSGLFMRGEHDRVALLCRNAFSWGLALLLPAVVVAELEPTFLVTILLRHGQFSPSDASLTADALRGFAPAILFESGYVVFYRVFYAIRQPLVPVALSISGVAFLTLLLEITAPRGGIGALGGSLSASFGIVLAATIPALLACFGRRVLPTPRQVLIPLGAASVGAALLLFARPFPDAFWPNSLLIVAFVLAYGTMVTLGLPEGRGMLLALRQPAGSRGVERNPSEPGVG